jgi:hypothetical protein
MYYAPIELLAPLHTQKISDHFTHSEIMFQYICLRPIIANQITDPNNSNRACFIEFPIMVPV